MYKIEWQDDHENQLEGMWNQAAVAQFKVLSGHFPRGTEEHWEESQIG